MGLNNLTNKIKGFLPAAYNRVSGYANDVGVVTDYVGEGIGQATKNMPIVKRVF